MCRILIIEDDMVDQMALVRVLQQATSSFQISLSSCIKEACQQIKKQKPDLIISDLHLPDGSAFDLPVNFNKIPLILITGNKPEDFQSFTAKGAKVVLLKDIKLQYLQQLQSVISMVLAKKPASIAKLPDLKKQVPDFPKNIALLRATFNNDKKIISELIITFLKEGPANLINMQLAFQKKDFEQLQKIAHQLKSQFLLMGFKELYQCTSQLESLAASQDFSANDLLKKLVADSTIAFRQLEEYLEGVK